MFTTEKPQFTADIWLNAQEDFFFLNYKFRRTLIYDTHYYSHSDPHMQTVWYIGDSEGKNNKEWRFFPLHFPTLCFDTVDRLVR